VQEGRQRLAVLARGAEALGLSLSPAQLDAFAVYLEELLRASPAADLTAVREPDEVQRRHFLESLALGVALVRLGLLPEGQAVRAIDIGTGGGLPGLPLRIVWPSLRLTLLDSERRKTEFVRSLLSRLGLPDVEVVWGRAEEVARDPRHRQAYDLALARALAPLPVLAELALPFLRLGGHLVSPKGERVQREVAEGMAAPPGQMSFLSVEMQYFAQVQVLFVIPPAAFRPPPKVYSAVVRLDVRSAPPVDVDDVDSFLRVAQAGFAAPRKQLRNSLAIGLSLAPAEAGEIIAAAGLEPQRRPGTLDLAEWARLYRAVTARGALARA